MDNEMVDLSKGESIELLVDEERAELLLNEDGVALDDMEKTKEMMRKPNHELEKKVEDEERKRLTVDEFLMNLGGFGRYQAILLMAAYLSIGLCTSWQSIVGVFIHDSSICEGSNGNGYGGKYVWESWDLGCENHWKLSLVDTLYFIGWFIGDGVFGYFADKKGRRLIIIITSILGCVSSIAHALSPNFAFYLVTRIIQGTAIGGLTTVMFVLTIEFLSPSLRSFVGCSINGAFAVGVLILVPIAKYIDSWRVMYFILAIPFLIILILYSFLDESPRFLLTMGDSTKAAKILTKVSKFNIPKSKREKFNPNYFIKENLQNELEIPGNGAHGQFKDLFSRELFKRVAVMFYIWIIASLIYYALSLGVGNLGRDLYTTTLISSGVEFAGCTFAGVILQLIGRKKGLFFHMFSSAICCLVFVFLGDSTVGIAASMIGKFAVSACYAIVYVYGCEITPTSVRSLALGVFSQGGRIGSALAPTFVLLGQFSLSLPYIIFTVLAVSASFLIYFLPETKNVPLFDTKQRTSEKTIIP